MSKTLVLTGNYAVAYATKLARVDVVAAYPITPQTTIVEKIAELIESGEMNALMINVESEHSALAACYGAALAGARVFTATSSHGLLYMHEWLHWFSRARLPSVMAIVTRTIGTPWNIWSDHFDFYDQRDTGWLLNFAMDNQEVLDLTIQSFKISEDPRVYLPVLVAIDAFILSHTATPVELPDEDAVAEWLGPRRQGYVVDGSDTIAVGNLALPEDTEELFMDIQKAMEESFTVIKEVDQEYGKLFGRSYGGLIQCINCEDAKYYTVAMGSWTGDLIEAVNKLRGEGYPIGVVRIRFYRPFPHRDLWDRLNNAKGILVYDRGLSFGAWGPLYTDLVTGMYNYTRKLPIISNIVAGIGGVNITHSDFYELTKQFVDEIEKGNEPIRFKWYHKR
ncbi:MAG: pyruvate ferredoxin oxidoreductase [Desulfurococcaceae archaeon]|uniref:2-oxoacid oxidoreductase (ferredoxin) n=1 Tax=Staphylothermus marinus TaxID=2280 RepID=A0A7C4HB26_STAMA